MASYGAPDANEEGVLREQDALLSSSFEPFYFAAAKRLATSFQFTTFQNAEM